MGACFGHARLTNCNCCSAAKPDIEFDEHINSLRPILNDTDDKQEQKRRLLSSPPAIRIVGVDDDDDDDKKFFDKNESNALNNFKWQRRRRRHYSERGWKPKLPSISSLPFIDLRYTNQAQRLIDKNLNSWNFDIFLLDQLTNGHSLTAIAIALFNYHKFFDRFQIDVLKLLKWSIIVERGYKPTNPYHNSTHAADVAQSSHCCLLSILNCGGGGGSSSSNSSSSPSSLLSSTTTNVDELEILAVILSAFTHDFDHPGVNQTFLILTKHPLAFLYGSNSILEEHHWRMGVGSLEESGLLSNLNNQQFSKVVDLMKIMILSTDVTKQPRILQTVRKWNHIDWNNLQSKTIVLQMALKCADIANPSKEWRYAKRWADRVCREFFLQSDLEALLGLKLTYDKATDNKASINLNFITLISRPLFVEWTRLIKCQLSKCMMKNLTDNEKNWKQLLLVAANNENFTFDDEDTESNAAAVVLSSLKLPVDSDQQHRRKSEPIKNLSIRLLPSLSDIRIRRKSAPPVKKIKSTKTMLQCNGSSKRFSFSQLRRSNSLPTNEDQNLLLIKSLLNARDKRRSSEPFSNTLTSIIERPA